MSHEEVATPRSPLAAGVGTTLGLELAVDGGPHLNRLRLLTRLAQAASSSLDLTRLLTAALTETDRHLPACVTLFWLASETTTTSDPAAPRHLTLAALSDTRPAASPVLDLKPGSVVAPEALGLTACLTASQALYTDLDRPDTPAGAGIAALAAAGATCSFAVPLRAGDHIVGIVQAVSFRTIGFTSEQLHLCSLAADLLGPALSHCQLYESLRTAYEDLRLTQQRLIFAEKMRALGELAGGMAHEFNNALCGTLGFLELSLRAPDLDPTLSRHLDAARQCAWDAARIVRRVQDFARRRDEAVSYTPVSLNELVQKTFDVARLKGDFAARRGPICFELQPETTSSDLVLADETELRQVLTNLVFNAIDAMPDGGTLRVRTWNHAPHLYLQVHDTGIGMAPEIQQRVFEPFFSTKGERGNGLGLSVVYGIIQRHGGDITVESALGHGTTFTVRLPLAQRT